MNNTRFFNVAEKPLQYTTYNFYHVCMSDREKTTEFR